MGQFFGLLIELMIKCVLFYTICLNGYIDWWSTHIYTFSVVYICRVFFLNIVQHEQLSVHYLRYWRHLLFLSRTFLSCLVWLRVFYNNYQVLCLLLLFLPDWMLCQLCGQYKGKSRWHWGRPVPQCPSRNPLLHCVAKVFMNEWGELRCRLMDNRSIKLSPEWAVMLLVVVVVVVVLGMSTCWQIEWLLFISLHTCYVMKQYQQHIPH